MRLGTKIVFGFVSINFIFIILVGVVFMFMRPVQSGSLDMSENLLPLLNQAAAIRYNMAMEGSEVRDFLFSQRRESWDRAAFHGNELLKLFGDLDNNLKSPNAQTINIPTVEDPFNQLRQVYSQYHDKALLVPTQQQKMTDNRIAFIELYDKLAEAISDSLDDVIAAQHQAINKNNVSSNLAQGLNRLNLYRIVSDNVDMSIINAFRGILSCQQSFFDTAKKNIDEAASSIEFIRKDAAAYNMDLETIDEIAVMINALSNQLASIVATVNETQQSALTRGELNAQVRTYATSLEQAGIDMANRVANESSAAAVRVIWVLFIGAAVAVMVSLVTAYIITKSVTMPINRIIDSLFEEAQEIDTASGQLSSTSNSLAEGATQNAASLEETSAALEELTSMTIRNSDNAVEARALMSKAMEAVHQADGSMVNVIKAMDEITVSGNEIGKIIKTIDEIAFQTNLLALNAAVEAARAGEAGAGFAVVADEVRNLAIRSADAAKNTADLIASTISNINSGSEMVHTTADSFKIVEEHSSKVAELLAEVAEASKEQSQGIGQINTAMTQMDKVVQSSAGSAEESASAASQLSVQAGNLLSVVDDMNNMVHGGSGSAKPKKAVKSVSAAPTPRLDPPKRREGVESLPMHDDDFDF